MTRKIAYTAEAFAKRSLISKEAALFIVVEGRDTDTPFYEKIAETSNIVATRGYQIWLIEQITRTPPGLDVPKSAGGKQSMLALFDTYRASNSLTFANSSGRRSIVFCLDRDVDDVVGRLRRSAHLIYTPMADAEATLYANADFKRAISSAISIDSKSADDFTCRNVDWMTDLANLWREWIELACLASAHRAHCHISTKKPSAINKEFYGPILPDEVTRARQVITRKSQIPESDHPAIDAAVTSRLTRIFNSKNERRLLGKHWLSNYLLHLLREHFDDAPVALASFLHRAPLAFMSETDFQGKWADAYRQKFESLI